MYVTEVGWPTAAGQPATGTLLESWELASDEALPADRVPAATFDANPPAALQRFVYQENQPARPVPYSVTITQALGLIRPHVGSNIALVIYGISTDVVVPDDVNRENEIRQNLRSRTETGFGWDISLGTDFNIHNRVALEGGVRFLKSFGVPQQLGAGSMRVEPAYFQIYLGLGVGFRSTNH